MMRANKPAEINGLPKDLLEKLQRETVKKSYGISDEYEIKDMLTQCGTTLPEQYLDKLWVSRNNRKRTMTKNTISKTVNAAWPKDADGNLTGQVICFANNSNKDFIVYICRTKEHVNYIDNNKTSLGLTMLEWRHTTELEDFKSCCNNLWINLLSDSDELSSEDDFTPSEQHSDSKLMLVAGEAGTTNSNPSDRMNNTNGRSSSHGTNSNLLMPGKSNTTSTNGSSESDAKNDVTEITSLLDKTDTKNEDDSKEKKTSRSCCSLF